MGGAVESGGATGRDDGGALMKDDGPPVAL